MTPYRVILHSIATVLAVVLSAPMAFAQATGVLLTFLHFPKERVLFAGGPFSKQSRPNPSFTPSLQIINGYYHFLTTGKPETAYP